jgi:hypothetical protein
MGKGRMVVLWNNAPRFIRRGIGLHNSLLKEADWAIMVFIWWKAVTGEPDGRIIAQSFPIMSILFPTSYFLPDRTSYAIRA